MRGRHSILCGLGVVVLVCLAGHVAGQGAAGDERALARQDLKRLQGAWVAVSMEVDGDAVAADILDNRKAVYRDDLLSLMKDGEVYARGIITLDPLRTPKAMNTWDLTGRFADQSVPGIYELDGDRLKVCFARPGERRPSAFTTKEGSGFLLIAYKRAEP